MWPKRPMKSLVWSRHWRPYDSVSKCKLWNRKWMELLIRYVVFWSICLCCRVLLNAIELARWIHFTCRSWFASTLNRILVTAGVRCVSFIIVVLNASFARLLAAHANKKDGKKRRSSTKGCVLLVKTHWHLTSIAVFTVHAKTSLLYAFQRSIKANRNKNLW